MGHSRALVGLLAIGAMVACDDASTPGLPGDGGTQFNRDASVAPQRDAGTGALDAGSPRDASVSPVDDCDPVEQTCGPGSKCVVESGDNPGQGTACVAQTPNDVPRGGACTGRDCEPGLACVNETQTATSATCVKVCNLETAVGCESLGDAYDCNVRISGTNWGVCTELPPICVPYTQAPCAQTEACKPYRRRDGTWEFRCRSAGTGQDGDLCTAGNPRCARGLACVATQDGNAFCRQYCETNTDCTAPAQCIGSVREPSFMYCAE